MCDALQDVLLGEGEGDGVEEDGTTVLSFCDGDVLKSFLWSGILGGRSCIKLFFRSAFFLI